MNPRQRILIVKLSALGDIIHTMPIAAGIKEAYPDTFIGWLVSRPYHELLEGCPYIDRIFIFERRRWGGLTNFWKNRHGFAQVVRSIRESRFGTVLDFQGLLRSAFFTVIAGAPQTIGFANARELAFLAYNDKVMPPTLSMHAVERYRLLSQRLGPFPISEKFPFALTDTHREKVRELGTATPLVVFVPGARWLNKRWPPRYFSQLADLLLSRYPVRIVLAGSKEDTEIGEQLLQGVNEPGRVVNWIGKTSLKELVALMAAAKFVVTNDSGPMHIAAAVGTPTVALFGPTDPVRTGPYGKQHIVIKANMPCVACLKRNCAKTPLCLETILPTQVFEAIEAAALAV